VLSLFYKTLQKSSSFWIPSFLPSCISV